MYSYIESSSFYEKEYKSTEERLIGQKPSIAEIVEKTSFLSGVIYMIFTLFIITITKTLLLIGLIYCSYYIIETNNVDIIGEFDLSVCISFLILFAIFLAIYFISDFIYQSFENEYIKNYIDRVLKVFTRYFSFCLEQEKLNRCLPKLQEILIETPKFFVEVLGSCLYFFCIFLICFIAIAYFLHIKFAIIWFIILFSGIYFFLFQGSADLMFKTLTKSTQQSKLLDIINDTFQKTEYMILSGDFSFIVNSIFKEIDIFIKSNENLFYGFMSSNVLFYLIIFFCFFCLIISNYIILINTNNTELNNSKSRINNFINKTRSTTVVTSTNIGDIKINMIYIFITPIVCVIFMICFAPQIKLIALTNIHRDKIKFLILIAGNIKTINNEFEKSNLKPNIDSKLFNIPVFISCEKGIYVESF